jgi:hypothetical protein
MSHTPSEHTPVFIASIEILKLCKNKGTKEQPNLNELYKYMCMPKENKEHICIITQINRITNDVCVGCKWTTQSGWDKAYITVIMRILKAVPYMENGIDFIERIKEMILLVKRNIQNPLGNNLIDALLWIGTGNGVNAEQYYQIIVSVASLAKIDLLIPNRSDENAVQVYNNACKYRKTLEYEPIRIFLTNGFNTEQLHIFANDIVQKITVSTIPIFINRARTLYIYDPKIFINSIIIHLRNTAKINGKYTVVTHFINLLHSLYDTTQEHKNNMQWYDLVKNFNIEHPNAYNNFIQMIYDTVIQTELTESLCALAGECMAILNTHTQLIMQLLAADKHSEMCILILHIINRTGNNIENLQTHFTQEELKQLSHIQMTRRISMSIETIFSDVLKRPKNNYLPRSQLGMFHNLLVISNKC